MSKLVSMMLVAAVGFVSVRLGVLEEQGKAQLSKMVLYILQPCLIVLSFQIELTPARMRGFLAAFLFSIVIHAVFIAAGAFLRKTCGLGIVEEMSLIYTNCGNLILPIVSMTLGTEMVFYCSAYPITYNLLFWTHGVSRMRGTAGFDWKKIVLNPNIIAVFTGMLLLVTGIPIPGVIRSSMEMLEGMVGPCCMLVIGMTLAGGNVREILRSRKAYLVSFLRLLVFPLLVMALLRISGLLQRFPDLIPVLRVSFLAAAAPPGSNVAQTAVLFDREPVNAGIYNLLGMFFSVLTIPLIDYLYAVLF